MALNGIEHMIKATSYMYHQNHASQIAAHFSLMAVFQLLATFKTSALNDSQMTLYVCMYVYFSQAINMYMYMISITAY